jgi:V-type H+-transporting ATPase subunit D
MKNKLSGATKGPGLLKKKSDALSLRFRAIVGKILEAKEAMAKQMKEAQVSMIGARFSAGEFKYETDSFRVCAYRR